MSNSSKSNQNIQETAIHLHRDNLVKEIGLILQKLNNNKLNIPKVEQEHKQFINDCPRIWQRIIDGHFRRSDFQQLQIQNIQYKQNFLANDNNVNNKVNNNVNNVNNNYDYDELKAEADFELSENIAQRYLYPQFPIDSLPTKSQKEHAKSIIRQKIKKQKEQRQKQK